jgi:hypothetical protein
MRVVLAEAARAHFHPGGDDAFAAALAAVGLSARLLAFADHAYALPLLASACRRSNVDVSDPSLLESLQGAYYLCAARRAALLSMMERVGDAFAVESVPFLLLKGGALELLAPRAPTVRITADLDVLVPRGEMARCESLLSAAGFQPRYAAHIEEFRRHSHHAVPYVSGAGLGTVEVHETLCSRGAPARLPVEPFWERSLRVRRGNREWRVPSLEELALHTCVHYGLLHPYNTLLRRLWDLSVLSTLETWSAPPGIPTAIDWERVGASACHYGGRRVVREARAQLAWLLEPDGPVPDERGVQTGRSCASGPAEWPLDEAPYSGLAAFRLQQAATDTLGGRLRGAWHFLFPGPHETAPVRNGVPHWRYVLLRLAPWRWDEPAREDRP